MKMRQPPEFQVEYQDSGHFEVLVGDISRNGLLRIFLDDSLASEKFLPIGEGVGAWKKSWWLEEYALWQGTYDQAFGIDVPPGKHRIRVQNDSLDWIGIREYRFLNSGMHWPQVLEIKGVQNDENRLFWLRDESWNWRDVQMRGEPDSVRALAVALGGMPAGSYELLWLRTSDGLPIQSEYLNVGKQGRSNVEAPVFAGDIVLLISPVPFYRRWLWLGVALVLITILAWLSRKYILYNPRFKRG